MRTKLLNNFEIKNKKLFKILLIRRNGCEIANFLRSTSGLILSAVCGMEQRFLEFHWIKIEYGKYSQLFFLLLLSKLSSID